MNIRELSEEDILSLDKVQERVEELRSVLIERLRSLQSGNDVSEDTEEEMDPLDELDSLVSFSRSVTEGKYSLVSENYWDEYASHYAEETYGLGAVILACWHDDEFAAILRRGHSSADLNGVTFYF